MNKRITKVTLRAPATTANMGPGFDSMGMALDIFNTVSVELADSFEIAITGQGEDSLSRGLDNMVYRGLEAVYQETGSRPPTVHLSCHNEIPLKRGLGSSAAAVTAGLVAGNILSSACMSTEALLSLADRIEGHPDNAAPAFFGGCQIVIRNGGKLEAHSVPIADRVSAVLLIPDFEIPTDQARAALPAQVDMQSAVFNVGRAALLSIALSTGDSNVLRLATQDALHQPHRAHLFPPMQKIFCAALEAGADGVFLSGSGSTILALATENESRIAGAMLDTCVSEGVRGTTRIAHPCPTGVTIVDKAVEEA